MNKLLIALVLFVVSGANALGQADVHQIDFQNFTYEPFCIGEKPMKVTVKDGEFSEEKQMDGYVDRFYFKVFDTAYGDLTGDGKDEAITLTVCNTGGTGNFSEGFTFGIRSGKPALLARIPGGDRAYGGLRSAKVEKGLLVVESNDPGEGGASCCPELVITTKYRLASGKLIRVGTPAKRDLVPTEEVRFDRGLSGTDLPLKLPAGDRKRFTLSARAGQTIVVGTNSSQLAARLLEDARLTEGKNGFTALLPKTGKYTVEIQNSSDSDVDVTVTIEIISPRK